MYYDLGSNYEHYKEEINYSIKHNGCVEMELNSIVIQLLRSRKQSIHLSYRDVTTRKETKRTIEKGLKGSAGFPDFVVFQKSNDTIIGCIELKAVHIPITSSTNQLEGHIKSFNQVLYSNGLQFHYYIKEQGCIKTIELGTYYRNGIVWNDVSIWNELLLYLDTLWIGECNGYL